MNALGHNFQISYISNIVHSGKPAIQLHLLKLKDYSIIWHKKCATLHRLWSLIRKE
jgi:hypothetical protein